MKNCVNTKRGTSLFSWDWDSSNRILPFVAPKQDWDAFANVEIPPAPHPEKPESAYWHKSGEFYNYDMEFEKTRPLSREARENVRRGYLACVRYTDRQVGKVLTALDELGMRENTIVIVWGASWLVSGGFRIVGEACATGAGFEEYVDDPRTGCGGGGVEVGCSGGDCGYLSHAD